MFGTVIDKLGFKIAFVLLSEDEEGGKIPQFYELKEDEQIIEKDWAICNGMNKPKWDFDNKVWIDTEALPPVEPQPTQEDKTRIWQSKMEAGMAELALQTARNSLFKN